MKTSLTFRLLLPLALILILGLSIVGTAALRSLYSDQLSRLDSQLSATSREDPATKDYTHLTSPDSDTTASTTQSATPTTPTSPSTTPDTSRPSSPALSSGFYRALVTSSGTVADLFSPIGNTDSAPTLPTDLSKAPTTPFTVDSKSGPDWRVLVRPLSSGQYLVVALDMGQVDATTSHLLHVYIELALSCLALLLLLAYFVTYRALGDLRSLENTAEKVAEGDLSARAESSHTTEVESLGSTFNNMLDSLVDAMAAEAATSDKLRRFVSDASHELRTPLTSIRGYAELSRIMPTADHKDLSSRIEQEALRMTTLVEDLLLLARLDHSEEVELPLSSVDVVDLVRTTLELPAYQNLDHPIASSLFQASAKTNPDALRRVLINLVNNAVTHTPAGTPVYVTVKTLNGQVELSVSDEGPGLTPEQAEHVFDRFYRADTSRTRATGGTGLGLAITKELVDAMHGTITLSPTPKGGANFTVTVPAED